jgi:hypothetical protein
MIGDKADVHYGSWTRVASDGSGSTQQVVRLRDNINGYESNLGDKKNPTRHAYETLIDSYYVGTMEYTDTSDSSYFVRDSGTLPITSLYSLTGVHSIAAMKQSLYNRAIAQLNEKTRGGLDLSIAAAEYHSTAKMFGSLGRLGSYVKSGSGWLKNGLGTGGRNWLAYNLGWRPLVQDIYGSVDEYYRSKMPRLLEITAKASQKLGPVPVARLNLYEPKSSAKRSGIAGVHIHLRLRDKGFDIARWSSLNPVSIAWELMPYSFVVDYFYDIGAMLRGVETSLLYDNQFESGYITYLYADEAVHTDNYSARDGTSIISKNATSSYKFVSFERVPLGSYPLPRLPVLRLPTASTQLLTMAALLSQHLR